MSAPRLFVFLFFLYGFFFVVGQFWQQKKSRNGQQRSILFTFWILRFFERFLKGFLKISFKDSKKIKNCLDIHLKILRIYPKNPKPMNKCLFKQNEITKNSKNKTYSQFMLPVYLKHPLKGKKKVFVSRFEFFFSYSFEKKKIER